MHSNIKIIFFMPQQQKSKNLMDKTVLPLLLSLLERKHPSPASAQFLLVAQEFCVLLKAVQDQLTFYLFISTKECIYFESHYGSPFLFHISLALKKKKKKKSTLELGSAKDILTKFKETGNEWLVHEE